jgi:hypothetical protein
MESIDFNGRRTLSFLQLDRLNGVPKGTAFRHFRAIRHELEEGRDYFYLDAATHGSFIAQLQQRGLAYPGTPHVVLITESGYRRMLGPESGER